MPGPAAVGLILCMLICIFDLEAVVDLVWQGAPRLDEEKLAEMAPMIRAEVLRRLENLWKAMEPWVDGRPGPDGVLDRPDPRLVAAGLTALRQLSQLARLDQPAKQADERKQAGPELLERVRRELGELEARTAQASG